MKRRIIKIGDMDVGGSAPVHIVFEAGQTHLGFNNAKELINVAKDAGANAIKFQVYDSARLIPSTEIIDEYEILVDRKTGKREKRQEPLLHSLKRHELTFDEWRMLKEHAESLGITFFTTVCFPEEVDFLDKLDVDAFKICSGDVDNYPFIRYVSEKGRPVIIDTGSSTLGEVEKAVDVIRATGNEQIIINHCPSGYPAHLDSINLKTITTLRQMFEYPVAFSDHSPGWDMDIAAVALGADMIEKTITFDRMHPEPEHIMSVEPDEAKVMVTTIREMEVALGNTRPVWTEEQKRQTLQKRRSIFVKKTVMPGELISDDCLDYRRPGEGILAMYTDMVVGRTAATKIEAGAMLDWKDIR